MSTLTVRGFSGGLTDFHIGANPDKYKLADNLILDQYNNLISRPGSALDFTTNAARARVPVSLLSRRIGMLAPQFTGAAKSFTILKQAVEKLHYDNGTLMVELLGPASVSAFQLSSPITSQTAFSYSQWNEHTIITHEELSQRPVKVYRDASGVLQLRTAGLPRPGNGYTATGGSGANYIYSLVAKFSYSVGSVDYIDRSRTSLKSFTGIGTVTPASSPGVTVGSIPVLANANGDHYGTTVIKIEVYRTINNGTTLYYVGEVTNGTTSFTDTVSDVTLQTQIPLYTSGGEIDNDRPPKAKYVHSTSDFTYYGNGVEVSTDSTDGQILPQRLWQSKRGDPDSVPASFYADMEEPITGVSSVKSIPVVFCKGSIYRMDNSFDQFGRGGMIPRKISDSIGGVGQNSIVQTIEGLFFAGNDGFYFTDGYRVIPLSANFRDTYAKIVNSELKSKRIVGAMNVKENYVLWAADWEDNNEGPDNRRLFVLDLRTRAFTTWSSSYLGDLPKAAVVGNVSGTTVSGIPDTTGILAGQSVVGAGISPNTYVVSVVSATQLTISPSAAVISGASLSFLPEVPESLFFGKFCPSFLLFANDVLWMGTQNGFTTYFDKALPTDPKFDETITGAGAVSLDALPIYYSYKGAALDLGTTEYRKWVNGIVIKARPRFDLTSDVSIQPLGDNDDSGNFHQLEYVLFQSFFPWGDPIVPYGDPRLYQRRKTMADVKRRFPAGKLRCEYKQIALRTAFVKKYESLTYANATIAGSGVTRTVTIPGTGWPGDLKDYWISFLVDGYVKNYRILSRDSASQITILDAQSTLVPGADIQWAVRGYLRTSLIQLIEYSLYYEVLGASQSAYGGENAVNNA